MASIYAREQIKVAVAKICQTIGWHSVQTTSVEILTDILSHYLLQLGKSTADYANEFRMINPNLDHLALTFRDFHVNLCELEEYVKYVDFAEPPTLVSKFPLPKEDHLNFLKPGSKEVVTRPVYIHEHLPPMHPVLEVNENEVDEKKDEHEMLPKSEDLSPVFKRPDAASGDNFKRPKLLLEEGRPTREISSVIMTSSGFLSPAREGKLPEARAPLLSIDPIPQNNNVISTEPVKKPIKIIKKVEKKREKILKPGIDDKIKKGTSMKDVLKLKQAKTNNNYNSAILANNMLMNNDLKITQIPNKNLGASKNKLNKALEAAILKTEKLNTTITPIPINKSSFLTNQQPSIQNQHNKPQNIAQQFNFPLQNLQQNSVMHVDKLFTEPDKKKINILKKISNVKNEKFDNKFMKIKDEIKQESRESSPDLVIDEAASDIVNKVHHLSNDITIELIEPNTQKKSPEKMERSYFDDSPPGTPSTPKTPEMITHSPPLQIKEKRKRKDKTKVKKVPKHFNSPHKSADQDVIDLDMEPPKTPEALHIDVKPNPPMPPFSFFPNFPGPGLIPPPLNNPLFHHLPIAPIAISTFGQPPYIPPVHPGMPMNFMQQIKQDEAPIKSPVLSSFEKSANVNHVPEKELPVKLEKKGKEHKKEKKEKIKKKNKKDKLKSKAEKKKLKEEKKEKIKKDKKDKKKEKEMRADTEMGSVPKLTLKIGPVSPRPETPETKRKLNIKPVIKRDDEAMLPDSTDSSKREMSPELAKISALVTGQPKPKSNSVGNHISAEIYPPDTYSKKPVFKPIPKIRTKEIKKEPNYDVDLFNTPSSYIEDVAVKEVTSVPATPVRNGTGPGRPRVHSIKPKPIKTSKQATRQQLQLLHQQNVQQKQQTTIKDDEGNKVWICPACGRQDDGSPMIGCDDCDAWYHWVCVGIQVPPDDNEDWYCRNCINKKQRDLQTKEKKKRKKREKKEH